jgi:hypothetical protein
MDGHHLMGSLITCSGVCAQVKKKKKPSKVQEEEEEIIRLPRRGQCGRAAAARALSACCAAGCAKDCTGSSVRF